MRIPALYLLPALVGPLLLAGCARDAINGDRQNLSLPAALRTRITFEPLDRNQAQTYLSSERQTYKTYTDPMLERKAGLERGRAERYAEIRREFPECDRQKHCIQHVSKGEVSTFERFNDLTKELNAYDTELVELDTALRDWKMRLDLRTRAILNRFLVHEVLQLPSVSPRFQGVRIYSLESFESRRLMASNLLRYAPNDNLEPELLGDYDFRMLGQPVDEAAVIAAFEVFLMPPLNDFDQPTRFVVTMLVNTHQLDLRYYDKDFLKTWADKFIEPYQNDLRQQVYCDFYSISGDTLAPRFESARSRRCAEQRSLMRSLDAVKFPDRFPPDRWLLPIAYFPMQGSGE